jgi:hypothetical protein
MQAAISSNCETNENLSFVENWSDVLLGYRVGIGIFRPRVRTGSELKKIITLGIEKNIYDSGPGGIGIENSSRFRTLAMTPDKIRRISL